MNGLKKTLLVTACASAMALGATTAQAADMDVTDSDMNYYVSVFGGVAFAQAQDTTLSPGAFQYREKFKTGFVVGGALGVDGWLMDNLRTEVEVSYFSVKPKSYVSPIFASTALTGHLSSVNILANAWYDIDLDMGISPYLGGGVGVGIVSNRLVTLTGAGLTQSGSKVGFAFQLGAGFKYDISESVGLDVGYRFRGVIGTKPTSRLAAFTISRADDVYVHTVQAGISFKF